MGCGKWSAGPAFIIVASLNKWVIGGVGYNAWSFAGASDNPDYNLDIKVGGASPGGYFNDSWDDSVGLFEDATYQSRTDDAIKAFRIALKANGVDIDRVKISKGDLKANHNEVKPAKK